MLDVRDVIPPVFLHDAPVLSSIHEIHTRRKVRDAWLRQNEYARQDHNAISADRKDAENERDASHIAQKTGTQRYSYTCTTSPCIGKK